MNIDFPVYISKARPFDIRTYYKCLCTVYCTKDTFIEEEIEKIEGKVHSNCTLKANLHCRHYAYDCCTV